MKSIPHVIRFLILMTFFLSFELKAETLTVDVNYCNGLALVAHATAEARQRSEPIQQWKKNLRSLKGYGVKDNGNVLYNVLPDALKEVHEIYSSRAKPKEAYLASFNACMDNNYGKVAVVN